LRVIQNALWAGLPLIGALLGTLKGVLLPGLLIEMNSISKQLLDPEGYSSFKSEWGFSLTQTYILGLFPFGSRECLGDTQRQARELISGLSLGAKTKFMSFNRNQSRAVIGLFTGHNTLRRHFYLLGLFGQSTV
jgi:hypothetical protein